MRTRMTAVVVAMGIWEGWRARAIRSHGDELAWVRVRYKSPDGDASRLVSAVVRNRCSR